MIKKIKTERNVRQHKRFIEQYEFFENKLKNDRDTLTEEECVNIQHFLFNRQDEYENTEFIDIVDEDAINTENIAEHIIDKYKYNEDADNDIGFYDRFDVNVIDEIKEHKILNSETNRKNKIKTIMKDENHPSFIDFLIYYHNYTNK